MRKSEENKEQEKPKQKIKEVAKEARNAPIFSLLIACVILIGSSSSTAKSFLTACRDEDGDFSLPNLPEEYVPVIILTIGWAIFALFAFTKFGLFDNYLFNSTPSEAGLFGSPREASGSSSKTSTSSADEDDTEEEEKELLPEIGSKKSNDTYGTSVK